MICLIENFLMWQNLFTGYSTSDLNDKKRYAKGN